MNCSIIFNFCCSVDVCCVTILAPHNNFRWLSLFLCTCFIRTIVNAWVKQTFTPASFEVICQPPSIQFRRLNFGGLTCISFWFGVQHYRPFMLFQEFFFWICLCISLPLWCFSPSNLSRTPSDCALESHQGTKFHWALTPLLHMSLFCWQDSCLFGTPGSTPASHDTFSVFKKRKANKALVSYRCLAIKGGSISKQDLAQPVSCRATILLYPWGWVSGPQKMIPKSTDAQVSHMKCPGIPILSTHSLLYA